MWTVDARVLQRAVDSRTVCPVLCINGVGTAAEKVYDRNQGPTQTRADDGGQAAAQKIMEERDVFFAGQRLPQGIATLQ